MSKFAIAIHGGAGTITKSAMSAEKEKLYRQGLEEALRIGHQILNAGGSALDAVEKTVIALENNPLFNAGRGSVFTHAGNHEMDASIMCGKTLSAGAVAAVQQIRNPIVLANKIRVQGDYVLLFGPGAEAFAREQNLPFEEEDYFYDAFRYQQWQQAIQTNEVVLDHTEDKKFGTVGAVALDQAGNLAAATSTGGMTNKRYNRVGDSPIIGSGTYANNYTCAVSCTGHGEYFMRAVVAYDVACLMEYKGLTLKQACDFVVHVKLVKMGGEGGLIAIDNQGNIALPFNSEGMYRASKFNNESAVVSIYKD